MELLATSPVDESLIKTTQKKQLQLQKQQISIITQWSCHDSDLLEAENT
jgi:hypothetical protein